MSKKKVLVAGIGNIFFGDDAFGCEVIKKLLSKVLPPTIELIDFGIKTRALAFELCRHYDLVIVVDAVQRGGKTGTLYLIELATNDFSKQNVVLAHELKLGETIAFARELGAKINKILLVGCEPVSFECENLSQPVKLATDEAVKLIKKVIADEIAGVFSNSFIEA